MIYTLTLNPALDYQIYVEDYKPGQVNRAGYEKILPGGKGLNVATVLHHLGIETMALGFLAGFTGAAVASMIQQEGIPQDFIMLPKGNTRINIKLHTTEETEINGTGAVIDQGSMNLLYEKLDQMQQGDTLVLAGSIPSSLPDTIYCDIMKRYQDRGVNFAVDASRELLKNALAYHPFFIKPNHHELGELFGVKLYRFAEVVKYARKLQEWGARNILVSMAEKGAVLIDEEGEVYQQGAFRGKVISSTGAGDSMLAGFLAAYEKTKNPVQGLYLGIAAGCATAFSENLAPKEQIAELYKKLIQSE